MNSKFKLAILANENQEDHALWIAACEKRSHEIAREVIDLTANDWFIRVEQSKADVFIARPPGISAQFKQLYDERLYILAEIMKKPVYPSLMECLVYENKRLLSYLLKAQNIPHPATHVFYFKEEALDQCRQGNYPLVAKTNIGASGSGVRILNNFSDAEKYLKASFSGKGSPKRWGPNTSRGNWTKRAFYYILHPWKIGDKLALYVRKKSEKQSGFVVLQEFVPHDFEWRCVRIGDSYFAHKKIATAGKASGTLEKAYDNPPLQLFDFLYEITQKLGFTSLAVDMFETPGGEYLVNEMQCYFGQSDPWQMLIDEKPGRYRPVNGKWIFEEGMFNTNQSYDLRLDHLLSLYKKQEK